MKTLTPLLVVALLLSGCASNLFTKFYADYTKSAPPGALNKLLPYSGSTQVFRTGQPAADVKNMMARGYQCVGEANFWTTSTVTEVMLREQAKEVGADIVLYSSSFAGAKEVTVNVPYYVPGQTSTTSSTGTVNATARSNGGTAYGTANYYGNATTTTQGSIGFVPQQRTVEKYDHVATFWRRLKRPVLGARFDPLPEELRRQLGRNTGVIIRIVVEDAPAFVANILQGDVIIGLDGDPVVSPVDFGAKLERAAGRKITLKVIRGIQTLEIPVELNPST